MSDRHHDARDPGKPCHAPIPRAQWDRAPYNRWAFHHIRELLPTAPVWRGAAGSVPLPQDKIEIGQLVFEHDTGRQTVDDFLRDSFTDGFMVLKNGCIVAEYYLNGMRPHDIHLSQSVAKSVVGIVTGILIGRGEIRTDALVTDYLPELERTAYRGARIQHLLDMTSGVVFDETYTAEASHMAKLDAAAGWKDRKAEDWPQTVWDLILSLTETECPHGASFRYRSIETDVLAFALQRVSGLSLADLVSRELWSHLGAEEDACFTVDQTGYGLADGGFNATLRDYGRFGLVLAQGGRVGDRQIVPKTWIEDLAHGDHSLFGAADRLVLPKGAYHNQFWVEEAGKPVVMARGVFGQLIYIDPSENFVAVKLSSWPEFSNPARTRQTLAAIRAIRASL